MSGRWKRLLLLSLVLLVVLLGSGAWAAWRHYQSFLNTPLALTDSGRVFEIAPGSSLRSVAAELERLGILGSALLFRLHARLERQAGAIKAGEYELQPGLTPASLLQLLVSGRTRSYSITLVEGWNFREMMAVVGRHEALTHTLEGLPDDEVMTRLGYPGEHPEGRFFPDTYQFPRGTSDLQFLQRALRRMEQVLADHWENRRAGLPLQTPYDALILASIVEKETGAAHERPEIAGVFVRRLEKGMKLQTDPTVIYGMGERFDGNIRRRDLQEDTPYNTYVHKGLPPTPICMPGGDAIKAVLHPQEGNALYFVSRGNGTHQFSATLKQHNAAVRKYQLKR